MSASISGLWSQVEFLGNLNWAEAILLGIATTALLMVFLSIGLIAWRYFRPLPLTAEAIAKEPALAQTVDQPAPKATGGPSLRGSGFALPPLPFDPKGLYVGRMNVSVGQLAERREIAITAQGINATNRVLSLQRLQGHITVGEYNNGSAAKLGPLPAPWILDSNQEAQNIAHGSEFTIVIEQRVSADISEKIETIQNDYHLGLIFKDIDILMAIKGSTEAVRLPVWDGLTLSRDGQFRIGRLMSGSIKSKKSGS